MRRTLAHAWSPHSLDAGWRWPNRLRLITVVSDSVCNLLVACSAPVTALQHLAACHPAPSHHRTEPPLTLSESACVNLNGFATAWTGALVGLRDHVKMVAWGLQTMHCADHHAPCCLTAAVPAVSFHIQTLNGNPPLRCAVMPVQSLEGLGVADVSKGYGAAPGVSAWLDDNVLGPCCVLDVILAEVFGVFCELEVLVPDGALGEVKTCAGNGQTCSRALGLGPVPQAGHGASVSGAAKTLVACAPWFTPTSQAQGRHMIKQHWQCVRHTRHVSLPMPSPGSLSCSLALSSLTVM